MTYGDGGALVLDPEKAQEVLAVQTPPATYCWQMAIAAMTETTSDEMCFPSHVQNNLNKRLIVMQKNININGKYVVSGVCLLFSDSYSLFAIS